MPSDSRTPEVAVLGAAALDWVAQVQELPQVDGIVYAERYLPFPGGTGGNVAEAVARLGCRVSFLGKLGDDGNGKRLFKAFIEAGVDCSAISIQKGEPSASTFIAVDRRGERMIFSLGGAALYHKAEEIRPSWLTGVRILFIADAFTEPAIAAIQALDDGAKVVFNPGGLMVSLGLDALQPILSRSDVLILSRSEAQSLAGQLELDQALATLSHNGPPVIILTLGGKGAVIYDQGCLHQVPAFPVDRVADTTGAGDAFAAGVVRGILKGLDWVKSTEMGCAAAAIKIGHFGARSGLPNSWQVDALIQSRFEQKTIEVSI